MKFSIVIATHGDNRWMELAAARAIPSAQHQGAEIIAKHEPDATRAEVRNKLIKQASGDWIITLDADDELAPGYITAMSKAVQKNCLLTPRVSYVRKGKVGSPKFWPEVELKDGNWMVVGTAAPRDLMLSVGGWRSFTESGVLNEWDDWDMWIRCVQAGARIVKVPEAVYIAHVQPTSSHYFGARRKTRQFWLQEIRLANGFSQPEPGKT